MIVDAIGMVGASVVGAAVLVCATVGSVLSSVIGKWLLIDGNLLPSNGATGARSEVGAGSEFSVASLIDLQIPHTHLDRWSYLSPVPLFG